MEAGLRVGKYNVCQQYWCNFPCLPENGAYVYRIARGDARIKSSMHLHRAAAVSPETLRQLGSKFDRSRGHRNVLVLRVRGEPESLWIQSVGAVHRFHARG